MDDFAPGPPLPLVLDVCDEDLLERLTVLILQRREFRLSADPEDAAVVVTDRRSAPAEAGMPVVIVTEEPVLPSGIDVLTVPKTDLNLVLSAAHLLAAGYRIKPPRMGDGSRGFSPDGGEEHSGEEVHLSVREREVLELLVEGASNKVIARRLAISVHTAKFHVAAVLAKLGAHNRSDAVAIAFRDGHVKL
jgi:DNA-binding CsgD family transcriptional regulator